MSVYQKTIITGGGGMLAAALQQSLALHGGARVLHVFDRAGCDVTDPAAVRELFQKLKPTLVLNCAAYTKVDLAEQEVDRAMAVNGDGPKHLAMLCREFGAKLVHYSTDYVFDGALRRPLRPDDPVGPQSAYGRSKLAGEQAITAAAGLDFLILRTAWLYGPNGPNFVQTMVNVARAGKPLRVINDQAGAPTYTHDLADATFDLIDRNARGILHVTNAGQTTWFDFAKAIFEEFGLTPDLQPTTSADWKKLKPNSAYRPSYSVLDLSEYERTTDKTMRPWREALQEFRNTQ